jgi:hypothetical protein
MAKQSLSFALEPRASASFDDYVPIALVAGQQVIRDRGRRRQGGAARVPRRFAPVETIGEHLLGT